jgi:hypothetical protein
MARMHSIGKKAVTVAENLSSFDLAIPEDESLVKKTERNTGGVDYRWTELVTILKAYQETKISGPKSKNPGQSYMGVTLELKVAPDDGSINKGKRIFARFSVNPDELSSDEPGFGTARFINIANSLMPIASFDHDEEGGIPGDALNTMFPEVKDKVLVEGEPSVLNGMRAYVEILDTNQYDSTKREIILDKRKQDVEGFLPA